jgi:hypothetical protein
MGQPNRLPPTNVLPFPRARDEEKDPSQLRGSQGGDYRAGVIERSAGLAPQRYGILDGYLLVPLRGDDQRAILDALKRPHIVSSSGLRLLVIALVLLAVLPSLSAAAILWPSQADIAPSPSVDTSSNHRAEAIITLPAISMPTTLKATVGEKAPFPIAINGTDPFEGLGTIAISRLPVGSTFSAGVPHGETTWKVAPGEIDNLHLVLPNTARDETTLMIELLTPDGHVISDAATIVEVTAIPEARIPVRRVKTEIVPVHVWEQPHQASEDVDVEADPVSQTMALQSDLVPLPTRRPGPRR